MTKHTALLLTSMATACCAQAQQWEVLPTGVSTALRDVFFISTAKGWAVGDGNVILTTNDGGDSWTPQVSGMGGSTNLRAVYFTSATKGWVVGSNETLLTTDDGGATWTGTSSTPGTDYNDLIFTSPDTGYIVGGGGLTGVIKRTTNGGQTWSSTTVDRILNAVHFISGTKGWACGSRGVIHHTADGINWTQQVAAGSSQTLNLVAIHMLSEQEGWAGGNPANLKRTVDGGATWTNAPSGTNAGKTGIYFSDSQNGWASTTTPLGGGPCPSGCPLRYTTDGGLTWSSDSLQVVTINRLRFRDPALGAAAANNGLVLRFFSPSTGVEAPAEAANNILLSPNPVPEWLTITSAEPLRTVEVFDALGALVLRAQGDVKSIDVRAMPPGSYALRSTSVAGQQVQRFVKE
ncbi:MAG: YCF48-related protein [Flavobacteriales bacterium]|nr:MAG: YCF48-related protein [Flavobacteriales bacterium]